jgi:hypothetical protein
MDKFEIVLRHKATPEDSFERNHDFFIKEISKLSPPWDLATLEPLPEIGDNLSLTVSLNKVLGRGLNGGITYTYRGSEYIRDNAQHDDHLFIEFSPQKIDFGFIVSVFSSYVSAFDCYRATINNRSTARSDWQNIAQKCEDSGKDVNGRDGIYRINAINYFDRELCLRSFSLSPEQIIERLEGKVESVSLLHDGVFLVYSSKLLERGELENIDSEIRLLLKS